MEKPNHIITNRTALSWPGFSDLPFEPFPFGPSPGEVEHNPPSTSGSSPAPPSASGGSRTTAETASRCSGALIRRDRNHLPFRRHRYRPRRRLLGRSRHPQCGCSAGNRRLTDRVLHRGLQVPPVPWPRSQTPDHRKGCRHVLGWGLAEIVSECVHDSKEVFK